MLVPFDLSSLPKITCFGFVSYKDPWIHFKRKTTEYLVYVVIKGDLFIQEGDHHYHLRATDFCLLQPNQVHTGYKKASCDYYYIHFRHNDLPNHNRSLNEILEDIIHTRNMSLNSNPTGYFEQDNRMCYLPTHYHIDDLSFSTYLVHVLEESLKEYNRQFEHYRISFSCKLLEILINISKEYVATTIEDLKSTYSKDYQKVVSIQHFIHNNYTTKINSTTIEQTLNFNYDYLNRIFRKMTGYTIIYYLTLIRINKSKELIIQTNNKISDIAVQVGIKDPYYFSKTFKKTTGYTPSEYRKIRV